MFKTILNGKMPTNESGKSAYIDLYAREDVTINVGDTALIPLGVAIDQEFLKAKFTEGVAEEDMVEAMQEYDFFKSGHAMQLMLADSLAENLTMQSGVKIINMDDENEIMIRVHNPSGTEQYFADASGSFCGAENSKKSYIIKKDTKVVQLMLISHRTYLFDIPSKTELESVTDE